MDAENLQKWKDEFQNERKKQFTKVRGLQKETTMRRKAMEMKAQIEAAKEEKRRKEALAERKAQHMEATMRFQKGIKNFKMQKEKISLEDVLKQISTPRSRLNSADSETRPRLNQNDLNNYYGINKKISITRRSSSVDSLNKLEEYSTFKSTNASNYRTTNFNIEQYNSNNLYRPIQNHHQQQQHQQNNLKQVINENQKQIHEMNREALKEFQNLIKTELGGQNSRPASSQTKYETMSEIGTIITIDDPNSDDDRDSMDTDSLLNARIESPDFSKNDKKVGNEIDFILPSNKIETDSFNHYFGVNPSENLKKTNFITSEPSKSELVKIDPPQIPPVKNMISSQSSSNIGKKQSKQIKSILKRSSSLDNNSLIISGLNRTAVNFKAEKLIKDSIDLANNRLNDGESNRKKSVRFASFDEAGKKIENMQQQEIMINVQNNILPQQQQQALNNPTSQTTSSNSDSNESNTRISSTNSIRRPVIKPRNTSQIKQKITEATTEPKTPINENSKPPLPISQNGYSNQNQKRKEFYQRNKLLTDKPYLQSPKNNQPKPLLSPSTNQIENNSNFVYNHMDEMKNPTQNDRIFRQVIQNYQENKSKNTPLSTTTVQPSQTQKINEEIYREFQMKNFKTDLNKDFNYTDSQITIQNDHQHNEPYRLTLNPQSITQQFIQKSYFNPQDKQIITVNGVDQVGLRRPFNTLTPNSKVMNDNASIRLAYLNTIQNQRQQTSFNNVQRVLSADNINRNQTQAIQLEIKYPMYSNIQNQNSPFLNITKQIRPVLSNEPSQTAKEVLDSMALFLKAEEMSAKNYTESQIINTVQDSNYKNGPKQGMTSLSMEEQRIKNSLMRLDERYNFLKTQTQPRFNQEELVKW
ncbi:unnamed protein product [Brachionus calyciflorus]|uniref:Uncharacterized protein n=1 Tax=Brachionus calyciflorus TaxID=104777 RepID=A0A813WYT0_9BILA|nr:unnamed protein product [Brachionus calyciflorus]